MSESAASVHVSSANVQGVKRPVNKPSSFLLMIAIICDLRGTRRLHKETQTRRRRRLQLVVLHLKTTEGPAISHVSAGV